MVVNRITTMGGRAGGGARSGGGGGARISLASLPDTIGKKETQEYRKLLHDYVHYPLSLNQEMATWYFQKYGLGESIQRLAKSKQLVQETKDLFKANFKGYTGEALTEMVDKLYRK